MALCDQRNLRRGKITFKRKLDCIISKLVNRNSANLISKFETCYFVTLSLPGLQKIKRKHFTNRKNENSNVNDSICVSP